MDTYKKALIEAMANAIDGAISDDRLISIISRLKLKFKDDADLVNALEDGYGLRFPTKKASGGKLSLVAHGISRGCKTEVKSWFTPEQIASLQTTMPMPDNMTIPKDDYNIYMCNHLYHGRLSASINEAGTEYTCTICGAKFAPEMPNDAEIDKSIRVISDIINLAKLCFPEEEYMEPFSYLMLPMIKKIKNLKSIAEPKLNITLKANTTDSNKESNLEGGDTTRKEATTMATNKKSEADTAVPTTDSNKESNLEGGDTTRKEAVVSMTTAIKSSLDTATIIAVLIKRNMNVVKLEREGITDIDRDLISAILSGDYPRLLKLEMDSNAVSNLKTVIAALNRNRKKITINDLIRVLNRGGYERRIDEEGRRIAANLFYTNLYGI